MRQNFTGKYKVIRLILLFLIVNLSTIMAQDNLKLHYSFSQVLGNEVVDESGNGYNADILNGALIKKVGTIDVLDLGDANGYLDLRAGVGSLIGSLQDFSISTYIYVDESTNILSAGNFVWAFGNSANMAYDRNGGMFFSAIATRYAISLIHWTGEESVRNGSPLTKGEWIHLTYTQEGTSGKIYINGILIAQETITQSPSALGQTSYNYIGRSLYSSDAYLKNASFTDFRVYNTALSQAELEALQGSLAELNHDFYLQQLEEEANALNLGDLSEVVADLELPLEGSNGISISWSSSNAGVISNDGLVYRPAEGEAAATAVLTATFSKYGVSFEKTFAVTVLPFVSDQLSVERDAANISLEGNLENLRTHLLLPNEGMEGSAITWQSDKIDYLSTQGELIKLSPNGSGKLLVTLTATITKGSYSEQRVFEVYIAEDEGFSAYLFAYFTGNYIDDESIHFALSNDGFNYRALNNNEPVLSSSEISSTGGVRDPHILRGDDGNYYMVVTDMVSANGWSSNRAMVLLKSSDLVNWQSSVVNIQDKYMNQEDLLRVWAPQTIFDPLVGKYMIYWSMKHGDGPDIIYYAYANDTFTDLEGEPTQLFYHPENQSCIDGDIVYKDGQYHLFFKTEGSGNGIKKAVSEQLTSGYTLIDKYLQQTTEAVEGSSVFKLINSDVYILMYDMYTSGQYQFTESTDLEHFTITSQEVSMNFHPRHGTVIPITSDEAAVLFEEWGTNSDLIVLGAEGQSVEQESIVIDNSGRVVNLTVKEGTDVSSFDPGLVVMPGIAVSPSGPVDFSNGYFNYSLSVSGLGTVLYRVNIDLPTGMQKKEALVDHKMYPNPSSDWLTIVSPFDPKSINEISIYDYSGRRVLSKVVTDSKCQINIKHLSGRRFLLTYSKDNVVLWSEQLVKMD